MAVFAQATSRLEVTTYVAPWVLVPGAPAVRNGAVSINADGRLAAVGRARDFAGLPARQCTGVLLPGFVNAHTHIELSHMHVDGGDGLVPWIKNLLAERTPPKPSAIAQAIGTLESRGTVAIADVSNSGMTVAPLRASSLKWRVFLEVLTPRRGDPDPQWPEANENVVATAHSTYATREELLKRVGAASIHVEEDPAEAAWMQNHCGPFAELLRSGKAPGVRPVEYLDQLGLLRPGTLLVHMTCADSETLSLAARRGATVVLCPRSNLHIGKRLPPWQKVREAGCAIALGTDSLASCPSLDVAADAAVLARDGADPAWLLDALTTGGSRRLGFGPPVGWIEIGDAAANLSDPVSWVVHEGADAPVRRLTWQ